MAMVQFGGSNAGKDATSMIAAEIAKKHNQWDAHDYMVDYFSLNLNAASGNTTLQLPEIIASDASVRLVTATIKGGTYSGTLRNFAGVSVRASGVEYGSTAPTQLSGDSKKAFIIDFGGMRKVSALQKEGGLSSGGLKITLALPWMGVEFGEKPLYPLGADGPVPDTTGTTLLNFPETETAKLFIQLSGDISEPTGEGQTIVDKVLDYILIKSNTYPLNVRVAIADQAPFFTHAGELIGETSLPDFSAEVNAYLAGLGESDVESVNNIPLTVTTDLPGEVTLADYALAFDRVAIAKWNESSRHSINFSHQNIEEVTLEFAAMGGIDWQVNGLSMEIAHDFPKWRTFPRTFDDAPSSIIAKLAPDYNIAQCITINESTDLHGISLYVTEVEKEAELSVELVEDDDGEPAGKVIHSEVVKAPLTSEVQWFDVFFSNPVKTMAGKHIWFVMKSKTGSVGILLESGTIPAEQMARFNRQGAGWNTFPYKQGQVKVAFRHLREPAAGEDARVVELELQTDTISTDLLDEVTSVSFTYFNKETGVSSGPTLTPHGGKIHLGLKVRAHAPGTMTLQNVKILYQEI